MNSDTLISIIADFGPGFIVWRQFDGLQAKPLRLIIDRDPPAIYCMAEMHWFETAPVGRIEVKLNFLNEFKLSALAISGFALRSQPRCLKFCPNTDDDDQACGQALKLKIVPLKAEIWNLSSRTLESVHIFSEHDFYP